MSQKSNNFQDNTFQKARYYALVDSVLALTDTEQVKLQENGFVVSDRLVFPQFKRAYAWLYWKDLPVLVTTDAILHTVHQTYDNLLKQVEITILADKLLAVLAGARDYLRQEAVHSENLTSLYHDLDMYLTVPIALLVADSTRWLFPNNSSESLPENIWRWLSGFAVVNSHNNFIDSDMNPLHYPEPENEMVTLFGSERELDFAQFRARGHYDEPPRLVLYYCAMTWLQMLDFRFVEYDSQAMASLNRPQLAAAFLLLDAITQSGQLENWQDIDSLLSAFVGWSDNVTLNGLQRFFQDAGITTATDCFEFDERHLLNLLLENDYGRQAIRGPGQTRYAQLEGELPHDIRFSLFGQRYIIDSDIIQRLVYDKLVVNGEIVPRAFPSSFDVMYALGNDRALAHLTEELNYYQYADNLKAVRAWVNSHSEEFWQNTFYNHWLAAIRALNVDTTGTAYPDSMRSSAWDDKTLQTQLGSWTQLRHDNILYAKPVYSPSFVCEYPAGYVEPYPDFYARLVDYAQYGREMFERLVFAEDDETYEVLHTRLATEWGSENKRTNHSKKAASDLRDKMVSYFDKFAEIMTRLKSIAERELAGVDLTEEDNLFLRSIIVRKYVGDTGYGGWTEEHWDGWFTDLLPFDDDSAYLVADIHTNTDENLDEVGVLHSGTLDPVAMVFTATCAGQPTLFVGPVFTVREHMEHGNPPKRLTDRDWSRLNYRQSAGHLAYWERDQDYIQAYLQELEQTEDTDSKRLEWAQDRLRLTQKELAAIEIVEKLTWTQGFRTTSSKPRLLSLPDAYTDLIATLSPQLRDKLDIWVKQQSWGRGMYPSVENIAKYVQENPDEIRQIEGMTDALFQELVAALKEKQHL